MALTHSNGLPGSNNVTRRSCRVRLLRGRYHAQSLGATEAYSKRQTVLVVLVVGWLDLVVESKGEVLVRGCHANLPHGSPNNTVTP